MLKSILFRLGFVFSMLIVLVSCAEKKKPINYPETNLASEALIPKPKKIIATNSAFGLDQFTAIYTSPNNESFNDLGSFLSEKIGQITGLRLPVNDTEAGTIDRLIYINQSDSIDFGNEEAYQLYITNDTIILNAKTAEGAFRGIQTLRQIVPEKRNDTLAEHAVWPIPSGKIIDEPNFSYRGTMLDVARHFFNLEEVKKYIDLLAYYKINTLHLHLTDDQGWRIEIKKWPKLTEIGGSTEVGGTPGGFYTQEEYQELVAYANRHFITVVPEVDMPGHTNAASLSYPFLNGNGKPLKAYTGTKVGFSTFDTQKDTVYSFINDVVGEISALTPGPYFHIGGDESHVTKKKDYHYFVERVADIVKGHGKQMIGWDEVANAEIDSTTIVQFWQNKANAQKAFEKNMKVILSPAKKAYLDMQYDSLSKHGLHWAAYIPVDTAYLWSPEEYSGIGLENILGIEAPLWSETISNSDELEYLAFPRIIGYSELGWIEKQQRDWEDYRVRLAKQAPFLERMGVNYYPSEKIDWLQREHTLKEIEKD